MFQRDMLQMLRAVPILRPGGNCYRFVGSTQTLNAALGAGSIVFGMNVPTPTTGRGAFVERMYIKYTCLVAFAAPIMAGRALGLGSIQHTAITGGAAVTGATKTIVEGSSIITARIATTTALGGPVVSATENLGRVSLAAAGNAGAVVEREWSFGSVPIGISNGIGFDYIGPPKGLALFTPQAMDAGGQWELTVEVDTVEIPLDYIRVT